MYLAQNKLPGNAKSLEEVEQKYTLFYYGILFTPIVQVNTDLILEYCYNANPQIEAIPIILNKSIVHSQEQIPEEMQIWSKVITAIPKDRWPEVENFFCDFYIKTIDNKIIKLTQQKIKIENYNTENFDPTKPFVTCTALGIETNDTSYVFENAKYTDSMLIPALIRKLKNKNNYKMLNICENFNNEIGR
jgi:hypothetical protein